MKLKLVNVKMGIFMILIWLAKLVTIYSVKLVTKIIV